MLDEQNLILGEWPVNLNVRNQVFTCTGKFMHVLFEVHGSYLFFPGMESLTAGRANSARLLCNRIDAAEIPRSDRPYIIDRAEGLLSISESLQLCAIV